MIFVQSVTQETASQFVIPAKSASGGREPGSRKNFIILTFDRILRSRLTGGGFRNDGFTEL